MRINIFIPDEIMKKGEDIDIAVVGGSEEGVYHCQISEKTIESKFPTRRMLLILRAFLEATNNEEIYSLNALGERFIYPKDLIPILEKAGITMTPQAMGRALVSMGFESRGRKNLGVAYFRDDNTGRINTLNVLDLIDLEREMSRNSEQEI